MREEEEEEERTAAAEAVEAREPGVFRLNGSWEGRGREQEEWPRPMQTHARKHTHIDVADKGQSHSQTRASSTQIDSQTHRAGGCVRGRRGVV